MTMGILHWIYCEFMATFKPSPYIHVCQNYRFLYGLPSRWHPVYAMIKAKGDLKKK